MIMILNKKNKTKKNSLNKTVLYNRINNTQAKIIPAKWLQEDLWTKLIYKMKWVKIRQSPYSFKILIIKINISKDPTKSLKLLLI